MKYSISIEQKQYEVEVGTISGNIAEVFVNGTPYEVHVEKQGDAGLPPPSAQPVVKTEPIAVQPKSSAAPIAASGAGVIAAPIPGLIVEITARVGDKVKAGQVVIIMEAMKMENRLTTTIDGTVKEVRVQNGAQVATGDVLMIIA